MPNYGKVTGIVMSGEESGGVILLRLLIDSYLAIYDRLIKYTRRK